MEIITIMNAKKLSREELGSYYTNPIISNYVAKKIWSHRGLNSDTVRILDPALGNGNLLEPFFEIIPTKIMSSIEMFGYDLDSQAIDSANRRFSDFNVKKSFKSKDSLLLINDRDINKYDLIISNPPWGAKLFYSRQQLQSLGYETAVNQFDSYDLFIELSLKLLKRSGVAAFIIPDSIFQDQHEPIRRKLIDNTTILSIYRLGEGFFEGVFRSVVIIFFKNETPTNNHETKVTILRKSSRNQVLRGEESLANYEKFNSVKIKQDVFKENNYRFNVEVTESVDSEILSLIQSEGIYLDDFFQVGRGIEISKQGKYYFCSNCDYSSKVGKKEITSCPNCVGKLFIKPVVFKEKVDDSIQIVAGEDFFRYSLPNPRYILQDLKGLNYKTKMLTSCTEKILVRKTGLGLTATLDINKLHSNQVVFHITEKKISKFPIKVLLAILNSRVILFYHLKQSGETEWKSHPYITQTDLKNIPLPNLIGKVKEIKMIETLVDSIYRFGYSRELDLKIEKIVMKMFNIKFNHLRYINDFIKSIDQLKVISQAVLSEEELLKLGE